MFSKIICFVSSFLEFVLQMVNRLYDNLYTPHKDLKLDAYTVMRIPSASASVSALMFVCSINICTIYPDRITGF